MAVLGTGMDVVEIERMRRALAGPQGERQKARVFAVSERADCDAASHAVEARYAARFAAKEAVCMALGRGTRWGFAWPEIENSRTPAGAPEVRLHGCTAEKARSLGARRLFASLSHEKTIAVAHAIAEE
jgi:holo-[acyl-carrier protein] synthase